MHRESCNRYIFDYLLIQGKNPTISYQIEILEIEGTYLVLSTLERDDLKCIRLFRPQFRKVKIRFAVEIP